MSMLFPDPNPHDLKLAEIEDRMQYLEFKGMKE